MKRDMRQIHNALRGWLTPYKLKVCVLAGLSVVLTGLVACRAEQRNDEYEALVARAEAAEEEAARLSAQIQNREAEDLQAVVREEQENLTLAKILYGYEQAGAVTEAQKEIVACIPCNRAEPENALWPDDLLSVMQKEGAWQGYSEDNPVTKENYETARRVLDTYREDGIRPIGPEFTYLYVDKGTTQARTEYIETAKTRYVER